MTCLRKSVGYLALAAGLLIVAPGVLRAATLTFDDIAVPSSYDDTPMPSGYNGLTWSNFYVMDPSTSYSNSGYYNGRVSANNVIFNGYGASASVADGNFTFNSAYLTAAWNNGLQVEVQGYQGGVLKYDQTVTVDPYGPTLFNFNYQGIDTLVFRSSGGSYGGYGASGEQFVMDNFTYTTDPADSTPVPLPAAVWTALPLLGALGIVRKSRR